MAEPAAGTLPELATVPWRPLADERSLRRMAFWWTLTTLSHVVPFCAVAVLLFLLEPKTAPIGLLALGHAWVICEVYAQRGANVVKPKVPPEHGTPVSARRSGCSATWSATTPATATCARAWCASPGRSGCGSSARAAPCSCARAGGA